MKRYSIIAVDVAPYQVENECGEWVKYEDIKNQECICELIANVFTREKYRDNKIYELPLYRINNDIMLPGAAWICPAHGYKKL